MARFIGVIKPVSFSIQLEFEYSPNTIIELARFLKRPCAISCIMTKTSRRAREFDRIEFVSLSISLTCFGVIPRALFVASFISCFSLACSFSDWTNTGSASASFCARILMIESCSVLSSFSYSVTSPLIDLVIASISVRSSELYLIAESVAGSFRALAFPSRAYFSASMDATNFSDSLVATSLTAFSLLAVSSRRACRSPIPFCVNTKESETPEKLCVASLPRFATSAFIFWSAAVTCSPPVVVSERFTCPSLVAIPTPLVRWKYVVTCFDSLLPKADPLHQLCRLRKLISAAWKDAEVEHV